MPKKKRKRPTIRQGKAIKEILGNSGKISISKAMRKAGYSKNTSKTPKNLTDSKSWKQLMEEYIPDSLLAKKHKELLEIPKKIRYFKKGELETEYEELDSAAVSKGLDMGYKLKGKYAPEVFKGEVKTKLTDEQLNELLRRGKRPNR